MIDYLMDLCGSLLLYATPAFYVLSLSLLLGFCLASQMHVFWVRLLSGFGCVLLVIWLVVDHSDGEHEYSTEIEATRTHYPQTTAPPNRWDFGKDEPIHVVFLQPPYEDAKCQLSQLMQLKSMKAGFYMPIGNSYDALLYKQAPYQFELKIRSRATGHILIATQMYFQQPIRFQHRGVAYQLEYQHTDGVASVVQVFKVQCVSQGAV